MNCFRSVCSVFGTLTKTQGKMHFTDSFIYNFQMLKRVVFVTNSCTNCSMQVLDIINKLDAEKNVDSLDILGDLDFEVRKK